jgi:hypothetical protein
MSSDDVAAADNSDDETSWPSTTLVGEEGHVTEPAALAKPSLQLDALFLFLQAVAASSGPGSSAHTTHKLLKKRLALSRGVKVLRTKRHIHGYSTSDPQVLRTRQKFLRARIRQGLRTASCVSVRRRSLSVALAPVQDPEGEAEEYGDWGPEWNPQACPPAGPMSPSPL